MTMLHPIKTKVAIKLINDKELITTHDREVIIE